MITFARSLRALVVALLGGGSVLLAGTSLAAPRREASWGLPRDVSVDGHRIDELLQIGLVMTGALFLAMCIWMAIAIFKHGASHPAKYDHGDSKRSVIGALALAGGIFVVVDGTFFVNSTKDLHEVFNNFEGAERDPRAVRIEVNAHQWAWDARYAGPDGTFNTQDDIVTLNDLRVPVGAPVVIQLGSTDVVHSFYLPNLRTKVDAVPGALNRLWFIAKETGEFEIGCAQHCGTSHYKMRGVLTVLSPEDYAKWAAQASAVSARAYDENDAAAHWGWEWQKEL